MFVKYGGSLTSAVFMFDFIRLEAIPNAMRPLVEQTRASKIAASGASPVRVLEHNPAGTSDAYTGSSGAPPEESRGPGGGFVASSSQSKWR